MSELDVCLNGLRGPVGPVEVCKRKGSNNSATLLSN